MVNTLQKIYNRTPWQQKRLSQPLSDPNYISSPLQHSSVFEEVLDQPAQNHQHYYQEPSSSLPSSSSNPLQRQVSISEPDRSPRPPRPNSIGLRPGSSNIQRTNSNSNHTGNDDKNQDKGKANADPQPLKRGITRADTKISLRKSGKDSRRVFVNVPPPQQYLNKNGAPKFSYGSNRINTAKYTALTFLPKNLFEQFRRVANMFFLFMAIIQLTPTFTVGSPFLTVFPLCFVVGVTAIKDGFEDYKRHVEDRNFNQRLCQQLKNVANYNYPADVQKDRNIAAKTWSILSYNISEGITKMMRALKLSKEPSHDLSKMDFNDDDTSHPTPQQQTASQDGSTPEAAQPEFNKEQWCNLRVGDIIMLKNNQAVPADAIILSTSEAEGSCFIETKDLDGETNLKTRMSLHETSKYNTARRCSRLKCHIDIEPINANLFSFNGSLTMLARKRRVTEQRAGQSGNNRYSVYAPSITSSMMSSHRGSLDQNRNSLDDQHERGTAPVEGDDSIDPQLPAQGGTSASEYARLHKSATYKRRSRFSESQDAPASLTISNDNQPGDKQEYEESTETSYQDGRQRLETSSSLRPTISKRNSLHRTATGASVSGVSGIAKSVLRANHEQQMYQQRQQSPDDGLVRVSSHGQHNSGQYKETTIPVDINNMLLRGHVIRNTHWVIAVIVATGTETKIMLNSGETPSKRSRIEKTMNIQVAINFAILLVLCIICAVGSTINDRRWRDTTAQQLWANSTRGLVTEGVVTFFTSLIIFQNIIPISLYISIEFVKTFQAYLIWQDSDMYDMDLDEFCTPKTWNLTDDLGQIEYVFSDKTGTLTRNVMEFKKCTINGKIYGNNAVSGQTDAEKGLEMMDSGHGHDQEPGGESGVKSGQQQQSGDQDQEREKEAVLKDYDQVIRKMFEPTYMDPLETLSFADPDLLRDMNGQGGGASENRSTITAGSGNGEGSSTSTRRVANHAGASTPQHGGSPASNIRDFFTLLALCHTVVVEQPEEEILDDDDDEFGMYDDDGSPKNGVDKNANPVNSSQEQKGFHLGIRAKLKQKVGAAGLSVPGVTGNQASGSGTRSRKNSNTGPVMPLGNASRDNLNQQQGSGSNGSLNEQSKTKPTLQYRAESPDEAALVSAAKNVGYVFVSRGAAANTGEGDGKKESGNSRQNVNVNFLGQDHTYEQLDVIKFNSTRKRMTVIVREPQALGGRILLLTKGADNVIFERLSQNNDDQALRDQTEQDIEAFSNMGLRTLTLAQRVLDQETYEAWAAKYAEAGKALDDRSKKLDQVAEEIEKDLTLIGATAIEDKLQEGVPDSIAALREAGIKVWVLTGDKLETAINIGFASRLLEKDMKLEIMKMSRNEEPDHVLRRFKELVEGVLSGRGSPEEQSGAEFTSKSTKTQQSQSGNEKSTSPPVSPPASQSHRLAQQSPVDGSPCDEKHLPPTPSDTSLLYEPDHSIKNSQEQQHALIVDGSALKILLDDQNARKDLIRLSDVCFSVICCRASPLQKALVVELIRRGKKTVCLAIGDGANDVSMIQAANIGVGIAGQEGMQAAMASDYSITQFRFIRKLVLVHGHWGYMRIAEMILNFFFKNVLWVAAVLWFQIYCGFSAMLFYDYTFVSLYNLMLTAVPVLVLGATDQDLTAPYILRYPGVYKLGIHQKRYNQFRFVVYMLDGVWQSLVVFWFWRGVYGMNILSHSGIDSSLLEFSTSVAITNVVIASLYVGLHTYHWTWLMHVAVWGSIAFLVLMILIYGAFMSSPIYHVAIQLFSQGPFWFMLILSVVTAFLVRYTVLFVSFWWFPDDVHVARGIMIAEKRNAIAKGVKWTGLAPDGMAPQEQSEQEKAILKKEDEKKALKEAEKAEKQAAKDARKEKNRHGGKGRERSYDLSMVQINVNDHSQQPSEEHSSAVPYRTKNALPNQNQDQNQDQNQGQGQRPALPQTPLEIQRQLLQVQQQQQDRLAAVKPNDPAFQHSRRTSSYNYVNSLKDKPTALPPLPTPSIPSGSAAGSVASLHAQSAVPPPLPQQQQQQQQHQQEQ
ncbi:hypothetical protein BC939DRAFT_503323 [Gamsiella multidivaricata]|uniref:uncharacterized protein n=1 Tax=Gamsiella multidivaricata TaxID=101098 RepID=UPI002220C5E5|nr:uncharacterized protein BC939DRAFT_503323 [Gamsiella multidivaricata]KAG0365798.1 hypothetical protein BGZ54_006199 [Gamsiella multidivaricata]KAI7823400.1 hypothetical protein BC939DRAFT_503323 [Gamsiella multidivaricata]